MSDLPKFRGSHHLAVDAKSRFNVPKELITIFETACQGKLVICKNPVHCLNVYPLPAWERFEAHLTDLAATHGGEYEDWKRLYVGSATDVQIDNSSRVLIPHDLRAWAKIDAGEGKECRVRLMGNGAFLELWDIAHHDSTESDLSTKPRPPLLTAVKF